MSRYPSKLRFERYNVAKWRAFPRSSGVNLHLRLHRELSERPAAPIHNMSGYCGAFSGGMVIDLGRMMARCQENLTSYSDARGSLFSAMATSGMDVPGAREFESCEPERIRPTGWRRFARILSAIIESTVPLSATDGGLFASGRPTFLMTPTLVRRRSRTSCVVAHSNSHASMHLGREAFAPYTRGQAYVN